MGDVTQEGLVPHSVLKKSEDVTKTKLRQSVETLHSHSSEGKLLSLLCFFAYVSVPWGGEPVARRAIDTQNIRKGKIFGFLNFTFSSNDISEFSIPNILLLVL